MTSFDAQNFLRPIRRIGALSALLIAASIITGASDPFSKYAYSQNSVDTNRISTGKEGVRPIPIEGVIESLGVFKNGIVCVVERFDVPGSGRYVSLTPPRALHGTFFIQSDAIVETTLTEDVVDVPISDASDIDWTKDFQGKWLRVILPGESESRVVRIIPTSSPSKSSNLNERGNFFPYESRGNVVSSLSSNGVLLESKEGETIWVAVPAEIKSIAIVDGGLGSVERKQQQLVFNAVAKENRSTNGDPKNSDFTIRIFYLTTGVSWAPQYRVEIKDKETLEIEQTAVLINDWRDINDASITLYSGFPQIPLQNVESPMAPDVSLASFLASLSSKMTRGRNEIGMSSQMTTNSALYLNNAGGFTGGDLQVASDEESTSDGVDIFSQEVGKKTLAKGERVLFSIAKETAVYSRAVFWNISNYRDPNGRIVPLNETVNFNEDGASNSYGRTTSGEATTLPNRFVEPWDVLCFNNPLSFPFTTGPASVLENGKFLGQNTLYWTNSGEKTILPVTKALSVRVSSTEKERAFASSKSDENFLDLDFSNQTDSLSIDLNDLAGKVIRINGALYRVAIIDATITVVNQREEETPLQLTRQFSGRITPDSFEGFDETPQLSRLTSTMSGVGRFNYQNELRSSSVLKPGEKRTFKFSYQILVAQ